MKKFLSALLASILVCAVLVTAVSADTFVPSIGYKPAPDLLDDKDGKIIVTSVEEAKTTTKIPRVVADSLIAKFNEFSADGFKLSSVSEELNKLVAEHLGEGHDADDLVIRDFFNVQSMDEEIDNFMIVDGNTMTLDFAVDTKGAPIYVMVYVPDSSGTVEEVNNAAGGAFQPLTRVQNTAQIMPLGNRNWENGTWELADVKDNDDGSISITFEEFGHVAIMVPTVDSEITPPTGDDSADNTFWVALMIGASLLIVALVAANVRLSKREQM